MRRLYIALTLALLTVAGIFVTKSSHLFSLQDDPWALITPCNSSTFSFRDFRPLLLRPFDGHGDPRESYPDNAHILALNDVCIKKLIRSFGEDSIQTVFAYGRPELLLGAVANETLNELTLSAISVGDRFSFRHSKNITTFLNQLGETGGWDDELKRHARGFITYSNPQIVQNSDFTSESVLAELLEFAPVPLLDPDRINAICSQETSCPAPVKYDENICVTQNGKGLKAAYLSDPKAFYAAANKCQNEPLDLAVMFRFRGIYDGYCGIDLQANVAMKIGLSAAEECETILHDDYWTDAVAMPWAASHPLFIASLVKTHGHQYVAMHYTRAIEKYGLDSALRKLDSYLTRSGLRK